MKHIRLVLAGALLALGSATVVQAQSAPTGRMQGGQRGGRMMQMLMNGITLTADQQKQYDAIVAKYQDQMQSARTEANGDRDAMRTKMRDLMSKEGDEIKAILTDEQRKVYDQNVKDMEARRQQMGGGNPPGSH